MRWSCNIVKFAWTGYGCSYWVRRNPTYTKVPLFNLFNFMHVSQIRPCTRPSIAKEICSIDLRNKQTSTTAVAEPISARDLSRSSKFKTSSCIRNTNFWHIINVAKSRLSNMVNLHIILIACTVGYSHSIRRNISHQVHQVMQCCTAHLSTEYSWNSLL